MDIKQRLARIRFITVKPDLSNLATREVLALKECVRAARKMTDIYLDQMGPGIRKLYEQLRTGGPSTQDMFRLMQVHGSPWDGDDHDFPFVPDVGYRPLGVGMYPVNMLPGIWAAWLKQLPASDREKFQGPYTRITTDAVKGLKAVSYSEAYQDDLQEAADRLETAAALLPHGPLENFLRMRADGFRTNDYYASDVAWVGTDGTPFEATIGPYEVYFDRVAGLKASFEAFIGIPDRNANEALKKFSPAVPEVDAQLAERYKFKPSGGARPLEVVADVFRGGEAAAGIMFVAYNLPNDRRIRTEVGSKNVFSATMMRANFENLVLPVAQRVLSQADLDLCSFDRRLMFVIGHELAHGIGPSMVVVDGVPVPFEHVVGPLHSCIEEAKADMLGTVLLHHFAKKGLIDTDTLVGCVVTEVVAFLQRWRNGFSQAHSKGNLMQYNWLAELGAIRYDTITRKFAIDPYRALAGIEALAHEFIRLQASGDRAQAETFTQRWTVVPDGINELVASLADVPAKVYPTYEI